MRPLLHILEHVIDPRRPDDETILFGNDSGVWVGAAVAVLRAGNPAELAIRDADRVLNAYRYRAGSGLTGEQISAARATQKDYP